MGNDVDLGIDGGNESVRDRDLRHPQGIARPCSDQTIPVGLVEDVRIDDCQPTRAQVRQLLHDVRTQAAGSDDQHPRAAQPVLTVGSDGSSSTFDGNIVESGWALAGTWTPYDGPTWTTGTAPALSGVETAALLFGGNAADYRISTVSNQAGDINDMAWYDVYAVGRSLFADDYMVDGNGNGLYDQPGGRRLDGVRKKSATQTGCGSADATLAEPRPELLNGTGNTHARGVLVQPERLSDFHPALLFKEA